MANHEELRNLALVAAALIGIPLLIWRAISQDRSSRAALGNSKAAQENVKNATKSHLAETYSRAIDQLGAVGENNLPVIQTRLGGLYSLGEVARTGKEYHNPVMKVICAYARACPPSTNTLEVSPDIQACLEVVGKRNLSYDEKGGPLLNFEGVNFGKIVTFRLDLKYVYLKTSNLSGSFFGKINFSNAYLSFANLSNVEFSDCDLERAHLEDTDLKGADLRKAKNLTYRQINSAKIDRKTKLPDNISITWYDDGTYGCPPYEDREIEEFEQEEDSVRREIEGEENK